MPDPLALRVLHANQLVIDHRWSWRLSDPFWRVYFNRDPGAALVAEDGRRWELPPGRVVVVPPWADLHGVCAAPVRHVYLHVETPGLPATWIPRGSAVPLPLPADAVLTTMLDELAREAVPVYPTTGSDGRWRVPERSAGSGVRWWWRVQSCAARALVLAVEQLGPKTLADHAGGSGPDDLEPALAEIERHLAESLTVARLARRCALSKDHFARRFHQATGRTVMRYIQERRIAVAADRLLHSRADLDAIARETGFANRFHFTRTFTRLMGTPPARYRRQHGG